MIELSVILAAMFLLTYIMRLMFVVVNYKKMIGYYDGKNTIRKLLIPVYGFYYEMNNHVPY